MSPATPKPELDFFFVEAHPVGSDAWTTLPDIDGLRPAESRLLHPAVRPSSSRSTTCPPTKTAAARRPASPGSGGPADRCSQGWEQWRIDLSAYTPARKWRDRAGLRERRHRSAVRAWRNRRGRLHDRRGSDLVRGRRHGRMAGPGRSATTDGALIPTGSSAAVDDSCPRSAPSSRALWRASPRFLRVRGEHASATTRSATRAIVHDAPGVLFALENQTRPTYARQLLRRTSAGVSLVVHELAHQWFATACASMSGSTSG